MRYRQITFAERYTLSLLRQQGLWAAAIARILGRHRSTIDREVQRNRGHSNGAYRPPTGTRGAGAMAPTESTTITNASTSARGAFI